MRSVGSNRKANRSYFVWPAKTCCRPARFISILSTILLLAGSPASIRAQEIEIENDPAGRRVLFEFVKSDTVLPSSGPYFNVLRIQNQGDELFSGVVRITLPEGWNSIGFTASEISLSPGEEYLFPVRITIPPTVVGGISYLINAEIRGENYYDYNSSYVSISPVSRWDMYVPVKRVYLSEYKPQGVFSIELDNRGNSNEMIKLSFDTGELLEYVNPMENDSVLFVEMPAFSDTILHFSMRERTGLSYAEQRAMINNWRSSSIYVVASTPEYSRSAGIRVLPLESRNFSDIKLKNSPLNIDMTLNNLLSYQMPKVSAKVSGKILFPEMQQLQYNVGIYNLYFNAERNRNIDLMRQLRYMIRYNDKNTSVEIGDRMGLGELHTLSGQGIRARHTFNEDHTLYLNAANNSFNKNIGVHTGYSTAIRNLGINTGVTLETNTNTTDGHYSFHLGGSYNFLRNHRIRLYTATSLDQFSSGPYLENDTAKVGFAYRVSYRYNGSKFKFRIDNTNTRLSFLRTSGINRINMRSVYEFENNSRLEGIYYRNSYDASRYPYNFVFPSNKNITDNGHLLFSVTRGNMIYYTGPHITNSVRNYYNPNTGFSTIYRNTQPGMMGSVTFRLGMMRSITPYIRVNSMFVNYTSEDPLFEPYIINGQLQYTAGLSYYDKAFKFNAYFTSGDASDIYRTVVVEGDPSVNQSFHLRPYYERYFNKETIRVSGYLNYSYYLPSTRENMIFNLTSDFFLRDGWRVFLSFNLYRIVRADEVAGRITSRDINLLTGLRKSFDIQQPRLKFYDLTIVGFNDENGNRIKEPNEKPISNVMIRISRENNKNVVQRTGFSEVSLITDPNGEIFYEDIPEGLYDLQITALSNLENLYFLNGESQSLEVRNDMVHYLPLVETHKIKGRIIVDRDPNSDEGNISLEGIRITAVGEMGETYSVLTNSFGNYVLNLPRADNYEVSVYNVFGEQFILEQGRYKVQFVANKTVNLDFRFTEKRRELEFREGEQFYDFNIRREN